MPVIRNAHTYLTSGIGFSRHGRDVALKFKIQPDCVYDAASPRLTSAFRGISTEYLLAIFNSHIPTFFIKKFLNNTWYEITDLRMLPVVIPTKAQEKRLAELAERAMAVKKLGFSGGEVPNELAKYARELAAELEAKAPAYLRPPAQAATFQNPADCLAVIERAVNWEAEKLYGVEALGPFDDF